MFIQRFRPAQGVTPAIARGASFFNLSVAIWIHDLLRYRLGINGSSCFRPDDFTLYRHVSLGPAERVVPIGFLADVRTLGMTSSVDRRAIARYPIGVRKRLRKFVFEERGFVYYFTDWNLFIISSDKRFSIRLCHLFFPWEMRPDGFTPLEIRGPEFPNCDRAKGERIWVKYPFVLHGDSTPGIVRQILEWCFDPERKVEQVGTEQLRASLIEGDG